MLGQQKAWTRWTADEVASIQRKSHTGHYTYTNIRTPTHAQTHKQECVFCKVGPWKQTFLASMDDRSIVIYFLLTLYHHKENWYKWKKIYFKYLHLKFWAVKKHFVDKDVEWRVSREKLLDALFSCHKHHTSERTILLNIPFFSCFFSSFLLKHTGRKKRKENWKSIHLSKVWSWSNI